MKHYILDDDHHPVEVPVLVWAQWWEMATNRIVDNTQINSEVTVSTIFLGLDHNWSNRGPGVFFETMIFGGALDRDCWRYCSWDDAETGHKAAVRKARIAAHQKVE
jgi:hypothetical protein